MCTQIRGACALVHSIALSSRRDIVSGSKDKTLRMLDLTWNLEFSKPVDGDEGVRQYLEIFLTIRKSKWTEEDFQTLIAELAEKRGYGWLRPDWIRKELEKMTKIYSN